MNNKNQINEIKNRTAMNNGQWISLFRETVLDDATMHRWHTLFEAQYPRAHQSFLEWLTLSDTEIKCIHST